MKKEQKLLRRMNTKAQDLLIPDEDLRLVLNAEYDDKLGAIRKVKGYEQVGDNLTGGAPVTQDISSQDDFDDGTHSSTYATESGDLRLQGGLISQDFYGGFITLFGGNGNITQRYESLSSLLNGYSVLLYRVGNPGDISGAIFEENANANQAGTSVGTFTIAESAIPQDTLFRLNVLFTGGVAHTAGVKRWMYHAVAGGDSSNYYRFYVATADFFADAWFWNDRTTNMKGWWKLNETSGNRSDSSGQGNTLTDNNTVGSTSDAQHGALSADFEASNSESLTIADNASLSITGALTLAAWFKPESISSQFIASKYNEQGSQVAYWIQMLSTGAVRFGINDSSGTSAYVDSTSTLTAGTWYHVAGVFDPSNNMKLYINGAVVASNTSSVPANIADTTAEFAIGTGTLSNGSRSDFADGLIDDVRIYNEALDVAAIAGLARTGDQTLRWNWKYATSGNWLSDTITAIPDLSNITLRFRDLDANYYISQVDITNTSGSVQSSYTTDITEGTEKILISSDFSSGFTYAQNNSFKIKITLASLTGVLSPVIESISLSSPSNILELSPHYKSNGQRSLMAVVGSTIKKLVSDIWVNMKTDLSAGQATSSTIFRASAKTSSTNSTATGGDSTNLANTSDTTSAINQWQGYFIHITGGTGIGQIRVIQSNTGTSSSTTTSTSTTTTTTTTTSTSTSTTTTTTIT